MTSDLRYQERVTYLNAPRKPIRLSGAFVGVDSCHSCAVDTLGLSYVPLAGALPLQPRAEGLGAPPPAVIDRRVCRSRSPSPRAWNESSDPHCFPSQAGFALTG